ncbi:MAG: hypothetical protein K2L01_05900 [Rikenellaceae bacterium]|nr:hypothetical protein [Rikenellaceae bacterium]
MKNKQDFILKVEGESVVSSLNRFVFKRFSRATTVWTDCAEHNILMFVTEGEALFSGGYDDLHPCGTTLNRKVMLLPAGRPFMVEFRPGCDVLTYSFDSYLPMDSSMYAEYLSSAQFACGECVAFDIPKLLLVKLVDLTQNIGLISSNETLTHLSMRKVIAVMQRCMKPAQTAKLFAIGGSELGGEICRYMKMVENRTNLTTKPIIVDF